MDLAKVGFGFVATSSIIVYLTVAFQNLPNAGVFYIFTNISDSGVSILTPMLFGFVTGCIFGAAMTAVFLFKSKRGAQSYDSMVADGWE